MFGLVRDGTPCGDNLVSIKIDKMEMDAWCEKNCVTHTVRMGIGRNLKSDQANLFFVQAVTLKYSIGYRMCGRGRRE